MADLHDGTPTPTRARLNELLKVVEPFAEPFESGWALEHARTMIEVNGAMRQRCVERENGTDALARWLAERFLQPPPALLPGRMFHVSGQGRWSTQRTDDPWFKLVVFSADSCA